MILCSINLNGCNEPIMLMIPLKFGITELEYIFFILFSLFRETVHSEPISVFLRKEKWVDKKYFLTEMYFFAKCLPLDYHQQIAAFSRPEKFISGESKKCI